MPSPIPSSAGAVTRAVDSLEISPLRRPRQPKDPPPDASCSTLAGVRSSAPTPRPASRIGCSHVLAHGRAIRTLPARPAPNECRARPRSKPYSSPIPWPHAPRPAYASGRFFTPPSEPCYRRGAGLGRQAGRNPFVARPSTECLQPSCSTRVDARRAGDRELALRWTEPAVDLDVRAWLQCR